MMQLSAFDATNWPMSHSLLAPQPRTEPRSGREPLGLAEASIPTRLTRDISSIHKHQLSLQLTIRTSYSGLAGLLVSSLFSVSPGIQKLDVAWTRLSTTRQAAEDRKMDALYEVQHHIDIDS